MKTNDEDLNSDEENELNKPEEVPSEGEIIDESTGSRGPKVRRRIKVRKRIRVRQKPSIKKKLKKFGEKAFWVLIVAGFITALVVMIIELDIRDERFKSKKKGVPTRLIF